MTGPSLDPIPDPLDLDAPEFTAEYRAEIVEWAVKTSRDALDPDCDTPEVRRCAVVDEITDLAERGIA